MEEKKLSEELRHCLYANSCSDCAYYEQEEETIAICNKLLQKVHEKMKELYEYKKLKKQGRLPELPCKSGDKIYYIVRGGRKDIIKSTKVIQIIIKDSIKIQCEKGVTLKPSQIFLIYEEAEAALKALKGKERE